MKKEEANLFNIIDVKLLLSLIAIFLLSILSFKFYREKKRYVNMLEYKSLTEKKFESDEEKIINLLKLHGGSMLQSTIVKDCGFSKSKTSEILKSMERNKIIRRERKGREKIVYLSNDRNLR